MLYFPITQMMFCTILMMIMIYLITTETPHLNLVLMTGIQFKYYFDNVYQIDKEGFNEILTIEVEEKNKQAILEAAKREAVKARVPPQVYKKEKVVVTKGSKKTAKSEVFGE